VFCVCFGALQAHGKAGALPAPRHAAALGALESLAEGESLPEAMTSDSLKKKANDKPVEQPVERAADRAAMHDNPLVPNAIERPVESEPVSMSC